MAIRNNTCSLPAFSCCIIDMNARQVKDVKKKYQGAMRLMAAARKDVEQQVKSMQAEERMALDKDKTPRRRGAPSLNPMSFADAIYNILFEATDLLHVDEIADILVKKGYVTSNKYGILNVVHQTLHQGVKEEWAAKSHKRGYWFGI